MVALFQAQVIRGGFYRKASERNRIRLIRLEAGDTVAGMAKIAAEKEEE